MKNKIIFDFQNVFIIFENNNLLNCEKTISLLQEIYVEHKNNEEYKLINNK